MNLSEEIVECCSMKMDRGLEEGHCMKEKKSAIIERVDADVERRFGDHSIIIYRPCVIEGVQSNIQGDRRK